MECSEIFYLKNNWAIAQNIKKLTLKKISPVSNTGESTSNKNPRNVDI